MKIHKKLEIWSENEVINFQNENVNMGGWGNVMKPECLSDSIDIYELC